MGTLKKIFKRRDKGLDTILKPEIKNDEFYRMIQWILATDPTIKTILEIGSSSGQGSTRAFVDMIAKKPVPPMLFCMDISKARFQNLKRYYKNRPFVKVYNQSSVPLTAFMSAADIKRFTIEHPHHCTHASLETMLRWLNMDVDYITDHAIPQNGIRTIMQEHALNRFDMVLIDGSAFTGAAELQMVYGADYLLLDDINDIKNLFNYRRLYADPAYELIAQNWVLRNGYAVFRKKRNLAP